MNLAPTNSFMRKSIHIILVFLFLPFILFAQDTGDSTNIKDLEQIIVTATRTERKLSNIAVPVQLVSQQSIRQAGFMRLQDVLGEQTGLYITSSGATSSAGGGVFGNGVQIQGLSPDYTLILLDGEPIIGRQGGVIDLSRLPVSNIKKIEIVKGPSSSLYGSEAMGGVVNIITEQAQHDRLDLSLRYGRFNTTDANLTAAMRNKKWGLQLFGNRNSSDGFDLDKSMPGQTVDPFRNYTSQIRFHLQPALKTRISLSAKYFNEDQDNYFITTDLATNTPMAIMGSGQVRDLNVNPVLTQQFSNHLRSSIRLYYSRYEYEQSLLKETDKSTYYYDFFRQEFYRAENQTDLTIANKHFMSVGGGLVQEKLNTTRYAGVRSNHNQYLFLQNEWRTNDELTLIGGLRFDNNSAYRSRLSPKLAAHYKLNEKVHLYGSYGGGFKAPDFRQLFLNFLNTAAGGYVVYGANEITLAEIERQQQEGIITEILPRAYQLSLLHPEVSNGINAGARFSLNEKLSFDLNLFRNDIDNLIQVDIIAYRNNGAPVYSYFNVQEAFTQGGELNAGWKFNDQFRLSGGYQYLMTGDKADIKRIKEGSVFTRDPATNETYKVSRSDYGGLPNRSAHMINVKILYDDQKSGWSGSLRAIYKSRWGTTDQDGNGLINRDEEYAPGFTQLNISGVKQIGAFRLQAGIDNLLNYKDVVYLPGQPGIQPYISVLYSFINKKNKQ